YDHNLYDKNRPIALRKDGDKAAEIGHQPDVQRKSAGCTNRKQRPCKDDRPGRTDHYQRHRQSCTDPETASPQEPPPLPSDYQQGNGTDNLRFERPESDQQARGKILALIKINEG